MPRIKYAFLLLLSMVLQCILSIVAGTIGFDNTTINTKAYLREIVSMSKCGILFKSDVTIQEKKEEVFGSQIGEYCTIDSASFDDYNFDITLIKSTPYDEEGKIYNNFGVYASVINGKQTNWKGLDESTNNIYISNKTASILCEEKGLSETELIGKKINTSNGVLFISGIYYTDLSTNISSSKGNCFDLSFEFASFVSSDYVCSCPFNSFLFLSPDDIETHIDLFKNFNNRCAEQGGTISLSTKMKDTIANGDVIEKIKSIKEFYTKSKAVIAVLLMIVSLVLVALEITLFKALSKLLSKKIERLATAISPFIIMCLGLIACRLIEFKSKLDVTITANNYGSVSLISAIFLLVTLFALKSAKIINLVNKLENKNYFKIKI